MLLNILIPSLTDRRHLLTRLLDELYKQIGNLSDPSQVEILVDSDNGEKSIGQKMFDLMQSATANYLCTIDDDDLVTGTYVKDIVDTLNNNAGVDVVTFKSLRVDISEVLDLGYYNEMRDARPNFPNGLAIMANQLCVWKREIAQSVSWPRVSQKECLNHYGYYVDEVWFRRVKETYPNLKEVHINRILYLYFYDPKVTRCQIQS